MDINSVPMADCHRHMSGSITPETVWQMLLRKGIDHDLSKIRSDMVFGDDEIPCFHRFLDKFNIFGSIDWCNNLVMMAVQDVCRQLELENTEYCLLDFSINKYVKSGWGAKDIITLIYKYFEHFRPGGVGLVLSLTYESPREDQEKYASLIYDDSIASMLVGIDLVGNEAFFDADFYKRVLTPWRRCGIMVRAHVGESQPVANIRSAIQDLEVTNVAHGIKLFDDPDLVRVAVDRDITFDLALTSNYLTGVWTDKTWHPLVRMLERGLKVTIGSDDPVVCRTDLSREYNVARMVGAGSHIPILQNTAYKEALRWIVR